MAWFQNLESIQDLFGALRRSVLFNEPFPFAVNENNVEIVGIQNVRLRLYIYNFYYVRLINL